MKEQYSIMNVLLDIFMSRSSFNFENNNGWRQFMRRVECERRACDLCCVQNITITHRAGCDGPSRVLSDDYLPTYTSTSLPAVAVADRWS